MTGRGPGSAAADRTVDRAGRITDWRQLFELVQQPAVVATLDGRVVAANQAFRDRFGCRDSRADLTETLYGPGASLDDHPELATGNVVYETSALAIPGAFLMSHTRIEHADGPWVMIQCTDISARENAELALRHSQAALLQSQKLETVGQLAGGIAHDFNNLLAAVMGQCELLLLDDLLSATVRRSIEQMLAASNRGAALTRQLLRFAKTEAVDPEVLDLNGVVADLQAILCRLVRENIRLEVRPSLRPAIVRFDRVRLEQVIMNLVVNASDAMPSGGRLEITVRHQVASKAGASDPIALSVVDTGIGMSPELQERALQPFVTTKDSGSGLGLAIVAAVVADHGAELTLSSKPGAGTTVTVVIPGIDAAMATSPLVERSAAVGGTETILVVEDESAVRLVVRSLLQSYGYRVLEAQDGADALRTIGSNPIDLVLTDLIMPGMSGIELIAEVRRSHPQIRAAVMSGHVPDEAVAAAIQTHKVPFLPKPFTAKDLAQLIRSTLGRAVK